MRLSQAWHVFSAKGAVSLLAWGNAPGFVESANPPALKARFIFAAISRYH